MIRGLLADRRTRRHHKNVEVRRQPSASR